MVANLHPTETLRDVRVELPREVIDHLVAVIPSRSRWSERLSGGPELRLPAEKLDAQGSVSIAEIPPLTPFYFEITADPANP